MELNWFGSIAPSSLGGRGEEKRGFRKPGGEGGPAWVPIAGVAWVVLGLQRDLRVFCFCGSAHKGKQMAAVGNNICVCYKYFLPGWDMPELQQGSALAPGAFPGKALLQAEAAGQPHLEERVLFVGKLPRVVFSFLISFPVPS